MELNEGPIRFPAGPAFQMSRIMQKGSFSNESHHEKTCFYAYAKIKDADQLCCDRAADQRGNRAADQHLCFCYTNSAIPLIPKFQASKPYSEVVQPGLCRTWSETPKTGFLMMLLKLVLS